MTDTTPADERGCDQLTVLLEEYDYLGLLSRIERSPQAAALVSWRAEEQASLQLVAEDRHQRREQLRRGLHRLIHQLPDDLAPSALCLSGGGIRSATFCLGVLQGLARKSLLDKFHYLSTVSGGGYIGSWLSTWIRRDGAGQVFDALAQPDTNEPAPIQRLRAYSNYLSPVVGLSGDYLTVVATFLRNLVLNWLILLPVLIAFLMLPRLFFAMTEAPLTLDGRAPPFGIDGLYVLGLLALAGTASLVVSIAYIASDLPGPPEASLSSRNKFVSWCLLPLVIAAMIMSWLVASLLASDRPSLLESSWTYVVAGALLHTAGAVAGTYWRGRRGIAAVPVATLADRAADWAFVVLSGAAGGYLLFKGAGWIQPWATLSDDTRLVYSTLSVPLLLGAYWLSMTLYAGLSRRLSSEEEREWWARASGAIIAVSLGWVLLFAFVYFAPGWLLSLPWLNSHKGTAFGASAVLSIIVAAIGFWSKNGAAIRQHADSVASAIGLRLLDLAALTAIVALLLILTLLPSWLLAQYSDAVDVESLAEQRFSQSREPSAFVTTCNATPRGSIRSQIACARAFEAAKELAVYSTWKNAAAEAPSACAQAANAQGLVDPATEALAAYQTQADARLRCAALTKLATESAYGPSGAGWMRLKHDASMLQSPPALLANSIVVLAALAFLVSVLTGTNAFSLHAMYGNRLVRAYLGATRGTGLSNNNPPRQPHWFTGFDPDDSLAMAETVGTTSANGPPKRLFHIINAALNVVRPAGDRLEWQERKAVSFTMTPLHCGTPRQGYVSSGSYSGTGGMTYARAMTISGAAATPSMGYHSSPFVTFLMALFNARLGWWLPNTASKFENGWSRSEPKPASLAHVSEMLGRTTDTSEFVYVSDGGHFENLGLYEMVRRRCRRILVVDAGCDPDYEYGDLANAIRKIRIDFGIDIDLSDDYPLPTPQTAQATQRHFGLGRIRYSAADGVDAPDGTLVYIKPVLSGDEPHDLRSYAAVMSKRKSPFPQQSTTDQFFDESQFESYRRLGLHSTIFQQSFFPDGYGWPKQAPQSNAAGPPATPAAAPTPEATHDAAASPDLTAKAADGFSSILGSLTAAKSAALLAGTLAVGGLVGVTGTVALRDATVSLKNSELTLAPSDRQLASAMIEALKASSGNQVLLFEAPALFGVLPILFEAAGTKNAYWAEDYLKTSYAKEIPSTEDVWAPKDKQRKDATNGVTLTGTAIATIDKLMSALEQCADDKSAARPIELRLIGFASSQDFCRTEEAITANNNNVSRDTLDALEPCESSIVNDKKAQEKAHPQSERLNVLTANRRASVVHEYINPKFAKPTLRIAKPTVHGTIDSMIDRRKYVDEIVDERLEFAENIARRAELQIVSAPGCPSLSALAKITATTVQQ